MGQVKQHWIEAEGRGYDLPDKGEKYVCPNHFEDPYLKQYVSEHSVAGECDYCEHGTQVVDLRDLVEYIAKKITEHYGNPDNQGLWLGNTFYDDDNEEIPGYQRVGPYITPDFAAYYESISELLSELAVSSDSRELDEDIGKCFLRDEWIQHDPAVMTKGQELSFMWTLFERMVKHEQRFTFFLKPEFQGDNLSSDNGLDDILTEISRLISQHGLCREIDQGTLLYRCRFITNDEVVDTFDKITSAPEDKAKQSRMSPAGVSMFYGTFDEDTAVIESSPTGNPTEDGNYVVGKFKTIKNLNVLDLTELPPSSFWMPSDWQGAAFLHSFRHQITKRIKRDNSIHIDYIPSQVFTEYLRYIYREGRAGRKIDGIIYPSSLNQAGKNIVLFCNQRASKEFVELMAFPNES